MARKKPQKRPQPQKKPFINVRKRVAGMFALLVGSLVIPEAVDPFADEMFGICRTDGPNMDGRSGNSGPMVIDQEQLDALFADIPPNVLFIGVLDTDHSSDQIQRVSFSDQMIERYRAADVRRIFIEADRSEQVHIDRFLRGEITNEEFYELAPQVSWVYDDALRRVQHDFIAAQMKKAFSAGIEIYAVDTRAQMPETELAIISAYFSGMVDVMEDECGSSHITDNGAAYYTLSRTWQSLVAGFASDAVWEARREERDLGRRMAETTRTGGGRSVIMYGADHFSHEPESFVSAIDSRLFYNIAVVDGAIPQLSGRVDAGINVATGDAWYRDEEAEMEEDLRSIYR